MHKLKSFIQSLVLVFTLFLSYPAFSDVQFGTSSSHKVKDVTLSDSVKADIAGKPVELKRATYGLRQKKVAVFWASVYVAQVFTNAKVDTASINALRESLIAGMPAVVSMTFLRNIEIKKIVDGYKDVFAENGVKAETTPYSTFLSAVQNSGEVKEGQTYYFVFSGDAKKTQVSFWTNGKEQYVLNDGDLNTTGNFMKMWMGKAVDSGLEQLQEQLLKPEFKVVTDTAFQPK